MEQTRDVNEPVTVPAEQSADGRAFPTLALILLAGAGVRLLLWLWFDGLPPRIFDEYSYNRLAVNIVEHGEFAFTPGHPTSLRPPLYPALVAGIYGLFGVDNYQAVRFFQAALSLVTVVLLYFLGREVFSSRPAGLWLAGAFCFYPGFLGANNLLLTETLFTFFLSGVCLTFVRGLRRESLGYLAATGALIGLAALTRSILYLFPPLLCLFLLAVWPGGLRRKVLAAIVLAVPFAAVITPWSIRNSRLQDTFVVIDVMGGRNFMMGNYEHTPLYRSWDAISIEGEQAWYNVLFADTPPGQRGTQGEVDKAALKHGMRFVAEHPGLTVKRDVVKFFDFWGLERELPAGALRGYFGDLAPSAIILMTLTIVGVYVIVLFSGVFGAVMAPPPDRRLHAFFLLLIALFCGIHTLVFAHSRYHLPIIPIILLYAVGAWLSAGRIWRARQHGTFWLASGICVLFVGGWVWQFVTVDWPIIRDQLLGG